MSAASPKNERSTNTTRANASTATSKDMASGGTSAATATAGVKGGLEILYVDDTHGAYLGFAGDGSSDVALDNEVSSYSSDEEDDMLYTQSGAGRATAAMPRDVASPYGPTTCHAGDALDGRSNMATPQRVVVAAIPAGGSIAPAVSGAPYRHRVYEHRVLPIEAYRFIEPPPMAPIFPSVTFEEPITEVAAADVGDALADAEPDYWAISVSATPGAKSAMPPAGILDYVDLAAAHGDRAAFHMETDMRSVAHALGPAEPALSAPQNQPVVRVPRPSRAVPSGPPAAGGVMCCYWKQGKCSMGSLCWYKHEGSPDTPCHYGVSCRKGHRDLVRSHPHVPPKDSRVTAAAVPETTTYCAAPAAAECEEQPQQLTSSSHGFGTPAAEDVMPPRRYVHEPRAQRPSAPLQESDLACAHCGQCGCVVTQEFPMFEGSRMRIGLRAHCRNCRRTFMVANN